MRFDRNVLGQSISLQMTMPTGHYRQQFLWQRTSCAPHATHMSKSCYHGIMAVACVWTFSSSNQWWNLTNGGTLAAPQVSMSCLNLVKTIHLFTKSSIVRPSCNMEPEFRQGSWAFGGTMGHKLGKQRDELSEVGPMQIAKRPKVSRQIC